MICKVISLVGALYLDSGQVCLLKLIFRFRAGRFEVDGYVYDANEEPKILMTGKWSESMSYQPCDAEGEPLPGTELKEVILFEVLFIFLIASSKRTFMLESHSVFRAYVGEGWVLLSGLFCNLFLVRCLELFIQLEF